jgi:hypothetical protein
MNYLRKNDKFKRLTCDLTIYPKYPGYPGIGEEELSKYLPV